MSSVLRYVKIIHRYRVHCLHVCIIKRSMVFSSFMALVSESVELLHASHSLLQDPLGMLLDSHYAMAEVFSELGLLIFLLDISFDVVVVAKGLAESIVVEKSLGILDVRMVTGISV